MILKLRKELSNLRLVAGELGYGVEMGTEKGVSYSVLFPTNDAHGPVTLMFVKVVAGDDSTQLDADKYDLVDGSSAGEETYYNLGRRD